MYHPILFPIFFLLTWVLCVTQVCLRYGCITGAWCSIYYVKQKPFVWIASMVISFEQFIYENSFFYDIMYLTNRSITPTFQNVSSVVHTGLTSNYKKYSKAPQQGILWQQRMHPPNYTHIKTSDNHCNGVGVTWWRKHPWRKSSLSKRKDFSEKLSWCVLPAFIKFLCDFFSGINYSPFSTYLGGPN